MSAASAAATSSAGGVGVDVDGNGGRTCRGDRRGGRHRRECRDDHLVAGADPVAEDGEPQGVGARADGDHVAAAGEVGPLALEAGQLVAPENDPGLEDATEGGLELGRHRRAAAAQIEELDARHLSLGGGPRSVRPATRRPPSGNAPASR